MATYSYQPLSPQGSEIRLATIQPGGENDEIVISLDPEPFSVEEPPSYEALSYVWGSSEDPETVYVLSSHSLTTQDERDKLVLPITQNLHIALKNLRLVDTPRVMWIDALCIDQHNNEEKSREVRRMNHIYRLARRVVVWLGPKSRDSDRTMRMMDRVGRMFEVNWTWCDISLAGNKDPETYIKPPLDHEDFTGFYHIICRTWFERLWIRQEVTLANQDAIVCCGKSSVLWTIFRKALACTWYIYINACPGVLPYDRTGFQFDIELEDRGYRLDRFFWQDSRIKLQGTRALFSEAECSDPRDRIYGIIHLIEERLDIEPNYSMTVWEVYEDVVLRYLNKFRLFRFLSLSQVSHLMA